MALAPGTVRDLAVGIASADAAEDIRSNIANGVQTGIPNTFTVGPQAFQSDAVNHSAVTIKGFPSQTVPILTVGPSTNRNAVRVWDTAGNSYAVTINPDTGQGGLQVRGEDTSPSFIVAEFVAGAGLTSPVLQVSGAAGGSLLRVFDTGGGSNASIFSARSASQVVFSLQMFTAHTADAFQIQDINGNILFHIDPSMDVMLAGLDSSSVSQNQFIITPGFADSTHASWKGKVDLKVPDFNSAGRTFLHAESDGSGANAAWFGTTGSFGGGRNVQFIPNAAVNPGSTPTGGGILYSNAGAGTWKGSSGTVTPFGPAGPHCGRCGHDFWRSAYHNDVWGSYLYECGVCGKTYKKCPASVHHHLSDEHKALILPDHMSEDFNGSSEYDSETQPSVELRDAGPATSEGVGEHPRVQSTLRKVWSKLFNG